MGTQCGTCPCPLAALPCALPPGSGNLPGRGGCGQLGPRLLSCQTHAAHAGAAPPSLYQTEDTLLAALTPFLWQSRRGVLSAVGSGAPTRAGMGATSRFRRAAAARRCLPPSRLDSPTSLVCQVELVALVADSKSRVEAAAADGCCPRAGVSSLCSVQAKHRQRRSGCFRVRANK